MSFNDGFRKSYKRTNDCNVDNSTRNWQKRGIHSGFLTKKPQNAGGNFKGIEVISKD